MSKSLLIKALELGAEMTKIYNEANIKSHSPKEYGQMLQNKKSNHKRK